MTSIQRSPFDGIEIGGTRTNPVYTQKGSTPSSTPTTQNWMENGVAKTGKAPAGTPYYTSSPLAADGSMTADADPFNAFKGYVGPEGGTFGANDANGYLSILGGKPGQYDALAGRLANDSALKSQWQGILTGDPKAIAAAAGGKDADLAAIAKNYQGNQWANPGDTMPVATSRTVANTTGVDYTGASSKPAIDQDPFGRFDDPASPTHGVITPQREAAIRAQSEQRFMNDQTQPQQDPFAQFQPGVSPVKNVGQNPVLLPQPTESATLAPSMANAMGFNPGTTYTLDGQAPTIADSPFASNPSMLRSGGGTIGRPTDVNGNNPTPDQTAINQEQTFSSPGFGASAGGGSFGGQAGPTSLGGGFGFNHWGKSARGFMPMQNRFRPVMRRPLPQAAQTQAGDQNGAPSAFNTQY